VPSYRGFVRVLKLNEPKHRISCHCTNTHTQRQSLNRLLSYARRLGEKKNGSYHQPDPPPDSPSAAVAHGTNRRLCCCTIWASDGIIECCTARRPPWLLCKHTACKLWLLLAETASVCNTEHQKHVEFDVITAPVMDVAIVWDKTLVRMWTDVSKEHITSIFRVKHQLNKKFSNLKIEVICSSETSVRKRTIRLYNSEDGHNQQENWL
jgi:hypothetical protein